MSMFRKAVTPWLATLLVLGALTAMLSGAFALPVQGYEPRDESKGELVYPVHPNTVIVELGDPIPGHALGIIWRIDRIVEWVRGPYLDCTPCDECPQVKVILVGWYSVTQSNVDRDLKKGDLVEICGNCYQEGPGGFLLFATDEPPHYVRKLASVSPTIQFDADQRELAAGQCTTLRWDVEHVQAVYLDGQGVAGHDTKQVCPAQTTTYTLRVVTADGDVHRTVTINVGPACTPDWKCKDSSHKAYQEADCSWRSETYCQYGCQNGECKSPTCTPDWKCKSASVRAYQNADCSWGAESHCTHGCENGQCKSPTCTKDWKCKDPHHKAFQQRDCSWRPGSETYCEYGCKDGACKAPSCTRGWECKDWHHKAYRKADCSWRPGSETYCEHGCEGGECKSAPPIVSLVVDDLETDKRQYRANEPVTFRFTVANNGTGEATFKPGVGVRDTQGVTTRRAGLEDYTLSPGQQMRVEYTVAPMGVLWPEEEVYWQVILRGPPPNYQERYVETEFASHFLVVPPEEAPIEAEVVIMDVNPRRLLEDDWTSIGFIVENRSEVDWTFAMATTVQGPGGYTRRLPERSWTVPRGQSSGMISVRWTVPYDAPAGTFDVQVAAYGAGEVAGMDQLPAAFMVDKGHSYVETRMSKGPLLGERVAIHFHTAPDDVPGSLLLMDVLAKLKTLLSAHGAAAGGLPEILAATVDLLGETTPDISAVQSRDGGVDVLFLQVESALNIGYLYNGLSFLDVGKIAVPATLTALPMEDIPVPAYWTLTDASSTPEPAAAQIKVPEVAPQPFELEFALRGSLGSSWVLYEESHGETQEAEMRRECVLGFFSCKPVAHIETRGGESLLVRVEWEDDAGVRRSLELPQVTIPTWGSGARASIRIDGSTALLESVKLQGCCTWAVRCVCPEATLWGMIADCGCLFW